jgi:hypothetical protein
VIDSYRSLVRQVIGAASLGGRSGKEHLDRENPPESWMPHAGTPRHTASTSTSLPRSEQPAVSQTTRRCLLPAIAGLGFNVSITTVRSFLQLLQTTFRTDLVIFRSLLTTSAKYQLLFDTRLRFRA